MNKRQLQLVRCVDAERERILSAERWLWGHPQTGFTEWEAHRYLTEQMYALGYRTVPAGNIPGFYAELDTGRSGPTVAVFGEMDALEMKNHPQAVNGMAHGCCHNAQCAALLGLAAALKSPDAGNGLCGRIRLYAVPAEEMIQLGFREALREAGTVSEISGKVEFMRRGLLDGVDMALMVHGAVAGPDEPYDFCCDLGMNGVIAKTVRFTGRSTHAGATPHLGINAQYAAVLALEACNALRETFREQDTARFHPILTGANCAVNIIPDEMGLESYVRGRTIAAMRRENDKINRAMAGAALAMGAGVELHDRLGAAPARHDPAFMHLIERCCADLVGADRIRFDYHGWSTLSSDFGDVTCVMPGVQLFCAGAAGSLHGTDLCIADPERLCVNAAKVQLLVLDALLGKGASAARQIVDGYEPEYPSVADYLAAVGRFRLDKSAVRYDERGHAAVDYLND